MGVGYFGEKSLFSSKNCLLLICLEKMFVLHISIDWCNENVRITFLHVPLEQCEMEREMPQSDLGIM